MSRRASPSTSRAYGILRVARLWGIRARRCIDITDATSGVPGDGLVRSDRCRMKRSTQPLPSGSRTKAGEFAMPRKASSRFIRTLKENLLWVRGFDTIEGLRLALHAFQAIYNQTWIVEHHGYQTPAAIRAAQLAPLHATA
jgi:hypothetical protein